MALRFVRNMPKILQIFGKRLLKREFGVKLIYSKGNVGINLDYETEGVMFEKDQLIMCGGHGVCRVVDVTGNPIDRLDKVRKYYVLEPVFEKGSTVYTPVDNDKVIMRRIMNKEEAEELVENITKINTVWIQEEKNREQMYKEAIRTYDCQSLVQIIKTLYMRKQDRLREGKKVLSSDEQYLHKAEELLYSEMSLALSIPKEEVGMYIKEAVHCQESLV